MLTTALLLVALSTPDTGAPPVPKAYPYLPTASKTPGVADKAATQHVVCTRSTKTVRDVSTETKHAVFAAYGIPITEHIAYEVDHLIALEIGGANDRENLWPQPWDLMMTWKGQEIRVGAKEKDEVENQLHRLVCAGKMKLADAQYIIKTDWLSYYLVEVLGARTRRRTP